MTHATRRRIGAVLTGAALLLAACGAPSTSPGATSGGSTPDATSTLGDSTTPSEAPQAQADVTFLMDFLASGWHAPAYAGVAQGFFEEEGFDVTVEPGQGSVDGATKVAANAAQFAQIDAVSAMNAMAEGGDLLLIGVIDQEFPGGLCYISERQTIDDFGDLMGLRIGSSEGDAYMVPLPGLVEEAGHDPEGYEHIVMTPANYTGALISDQIDAYACSRATFVPGSDAVGSESLTLEMFRYADTGFGPIGHSLVAHGELVREDPDLVQRFVNAWAKSHVWAWANPEEAMDDFLSAEPTVDRELAMRAFLDRQESYAAGDEFFTFDKEKLEATVEFINSAYGADLSPDEVYTSEFVDNLPDDVRQGELP